MGPAGDGTSEAGKAAIGVLQQSWWGYWGIEFGGNWDLREKRSAGSIPAFLGVMTCGLAGGTLLNLGLG